METLTSFLQLMASCACDTYFITAFGCVLIVGIFLMANSIGKNSENITSDIGNTLGVLAIGGVFYTCFCVVLTNNGRAHLGHAEIIILAIVTLICLIWVGVSLIWLVIELWALVKNR